MCEGTSIEIGSADSANDCLALCQNEPLCTWFNFNQELNACLLNEDCTNLDQTQQDFVTGERNCLLMERFHEVMFLGGNNPTNGDLEDVEIVSLNGSTTCMKPTNYPTQSRGMVGTIVNEMALVCGGWPHTSECFSYDFDVGVWQPQGSMAERRAYPAAVMLNDSHWWITGGNDGSTYFDTTELYNVQTNSFSPFVDLPSIVDSHVVLKLDETHFFLCCGYPLSGRSYILDLESEIWTETPRSQYDHDRGVAGMNSLPLNIP